MNSLFQTEDGFIGDQKEIDSLVSKNHARILTISDSHGNYRIFIKILKQFGPTCDALVFCGDGIGDLAEILEQANESLEMKQILPPVIAFVQGNGDPSTYPVSFDIGKYNRNAVNDLKGTLYVPEKQILTVNGTRFFITHGHYQGVYFGIDQLGLVTRLNRCQAALYGHTHISAQNNFSSCKLINPGSCSRPRGSDQAGCAIITVEKKFLDTAFIKIESPFSSDFSFRVK